MAGHRTMKIVRFKAMGKTRYGVLEGTHIVEYAGTPFATFKRGRKKYALKQAVLLTPVIPSKIAAVALNYRDIAEEMNRPVPADLQIFFKPVSALCGPDDPIVLPAHVGRVDYEGELAIVIRKRTYQVPPERAREHVLGYTCLNDVTARDLHGREGQSTRAKAFDTFCPVGPCIATDIDPGGMELETYVNGERRQASNTKHLVFPVDDVVSRVSAVMTLLPGDLIATGTPAGTGPIRAGDRVEVRIDGIGSLRNPVITL
jgi:2-keto-4-pentenoate hydratase/2-oxohepta-3-ene-1,7-dioic acid hydratase in catechol pathway